MGLFDSSMTLRNFHYHGFCLTWDEELGVGYFPVDEYNEANKIGEVYDADYFDKYVSYEGTISGDAINSARERMVRKYVKDFSSFVDVGIGSGTFVNTVGCMGTDVNPKALKWLEESGRMWYNAPVAYMSFWDSLEHFQDPGTILQSAIKGVFVSMPIYRGFDHIIVSKHFRPTEHYWYYTWRGFVDCMANKGFELVEFNRDETLAGREDIGSFYFERAQTV